MPTYQYRCTACGHDLEAVQKFTDPSLTECPNCGGSLRKVFNAVGVVFKGSGFYRTDSRKAGANGNGSGRRTRLGDGREEEVRRRVQTRPAPNLPAPKANGSASGKAAGRAAAHPQGVRAPA